MWTKGDTIYDFNCFVDAYVVYAIDNPKLVTVAERDRALLTYKEEMQNYLNGLSEAEITGDIRNVWPQRMSMKGRSRQFYIFSVYAGYRTDTLPDPAPPVKCPLMGEEKKTNCGDTSFSERM